MQQKIRSLIFSRFKPAPIGNLSISFPNLSEGEVCLVEVKPLSRDEIVHFDDEVFVRDGNVTRKLLGPDLTRWIKQRNN